jgi:hypothetical protein
MTDTTTDRVALLLDVFCSEHTDEDLPVQDWRHRDGRLVTDAEADTIRKTPLRDFRAALDLFDAELDMLRRQVEDGRRFAELMRPYPDTMLVKDILPLLPPEQRAEAEELWDRIAPGGYLILCGDGI